MSKHPNLITLMTAQRVPAYSRDSIHLMRKGGILGEGEEPEQMIERVLDAVLDVEQKFGARPKEIRAFRAEVEELLCAGLLALGTPILTNAGRKAAALSSCVAIPIGPRRPLESTLPTIEGHYSQSMGSGFNLDSEDDPVTIVEALNEHAQSLTAASSHERAIANMANIDIDHPRVLDFIPLKSSRDDLVHFNLSINVTSAFMACLETGGIFTLRDGTRVEASALYDSIVLAAWECGDPGLIFLERFNADNPTPHVGAYTTSAPCAEVGLAPGEACVFGYVNLAAFGRPGHPHGFDFSLLQRVVGPLTRLLDDALEVSLPLYPTERSRIVMAEKRKIGIGVCGFADLLVRLGIPYGSERSTRLLRDILLTITLHSKRASVDLARTRGSFPAFAMSRLKLEDGFLSNKYARIDSSVIDVTDWHDLEGAIGRYGLRNAVTTALPPSGRTARLLSVSTSIEPWFSLVGPDLEPRLEVVAAIQAETETEAERDEALAAIRRFGTVQGCNQLPPGLRMVLRRTAEITPAEHLLVAAEASRCVDEGISKTINLSANATPHTVALVFMEAWHLGMKAISVYRDGSRANQPEQLSG
ncbi:MAG: hypothetical protein O7H41_21550 [Planctomycetota bacterium]|nr:hypothetical protein [Planctomycetota bacterium]